ncbi:MAG: glycosyltransferase family 2 protein [Planctomycetes bacterium]|nr:glycosyltransferase family 2 protein [Planctomycetota bacterium]MBM4064399.1 glycosyltransferase family 2 protein [Planctomycetota bacterium]
MNQKNDNLSISIIIPVYNGEKHIGRCLDAVCASSYSPCEIIVVDDNSTDKTIDIARQKGVIVHQLPERAGPAVARNYGAKHAMGEILLFIDSDVEVRKDTLAAVNEDFRRYPKITAVFGSYDDTPSEENFLSQYRNLMHHFHHQQAREEAFSFWAGCGAIKKCVLMGIGGFDQNRYKKHSIEDIELGYRLCAKGHKILLDNRLLVKHLKQWKFIQMIRTDILLRAIPWSYLILESKYMPMDLNLKLHHKISTILAGIMIFLMPLLLLRGDDLFSFNFVMFIGIILFSFLILNKTFYVFFFRKKGIDFTIKVFPFHVLYYCYSGASFVLCCFIYYIRCFRRIVKRGRHTRNYKFK